MSASLVAPGCAFSLLRLRAVCLPAAAAAAALVANIAAAPAPRTGLCSVGVTIPAQHTKQATRDRRDDPLGSAVLVVQERSERVLHGVTDEGCMGGIDTTSCVFEVVAEAIREDLNHVLHDRFVHATPGQGAAHDFGHVPFEKVAG